MKACEFAFQQQLIKVEIYADNNVVWVSFAPNGVEIIDLFNDAIGNKLTETIGEEQVLCSNWEPCQEGYQADFASIDVVEVE